MDDSLHAVSPVDGRYVRYTRSLQPILSEYGLIRYRIQVMVLYLVALCDSAEMPISVDGAERETLLGILHVFTPEDAFAIKQLETKGWNGIAATNHDVKSCEIWLRWKLQNLQLERLIEWIHFGSTSEDVNNMAYGLMLRDAVDAIMHPLQKLVRTIANMAQEHADTAMISRTHGQAATPTTFGKECAVFVGRLQKQVRQLGSFVLTLKLNGASGNYAAMYAAFPDVDWPLFARQFIESGTYLKGGSYVRFEQNPLTTQIEPHDTYVELFDIMRRINLILVDFAQDMWRYISDDWVVQKPVAGEVGSSAMPHKINPIQFENAEGNLTIANGLIEMLGRKLAISRLQRDLSDSTVERVFGTVFAHSTIAYENLLGGMQKISVNKQKIAEVIGAHPEVLTEAIQTILRSVAYPNPYDALKTLSRGNKLDIADIQQFIEELDPALVDPTTKARMRELMPSNYIGLAGTLARSV